VLQTILELHDIIVAVVAAHQVLLHATPHPLRICSKARNMAVMLAVLAASGKRYAPWKAEFLI
jgi:hypothetical protein